MKRIIGYIFSGLAWFIYITGGLATLFLCWSIVREAMGPIWAFLSLLIIPMLLVVAPWFALFESGNFFPLLFVYGIWIIATVLIWIGHALRGID